MPCESAHESDAKVERCSAHCHLQALDSDCSWCGCRACDFCRRKVADAHAAWRTLPLDGLDVSAPAEGLATAVVVPSSVRTTSPTEVELAAFRCPHPAGCRFRFRPLNINGWHGWSLGSSPVATDMLPSPPAHAVRLEVRLLAPFTRERTLLEEVLLRDLAKALRIPRTSIQLVDLRLSSEYATVDLLGPEAYAAARRFHHLLASPGSVLFSGQAGRAIDAAAGLILIHPDGSAAPFKPPDTREWPTVSSALASVDEGIEQAIGIGPSQHTFWITAVMIGLIGSVVLGAAARFYRRACGLLGTRQRYRYSRSLQVSGQADGGDEEEDEDNADDFDDDAHEGSGVEAAARPLWRHSTNKGSVRPTACAADTPTYRIVHPPPPSHGSAVDALHQAAEAAGISRSDVVSL